MNTSEPGNAIPPPLPTLEVKLREVAEETGYAWKTIAWIFSSVVARDPNAAPSEGTRRGLSAEALCEKLIRHANDCCPGELRVMLEANHIFCSENIGEIVDGLVDKGLLVREEDDYFTDFDGLFDIEHLGAYLAAHGIRRKWLDWPRVQHRLSLTLCAIGISMVVADWLGIIKVPYAWLGWVIAVLGGLLSRLRTTPKAGTPKAQADAR